MTKQVAKVPINTEKYKGKAADQICYYLQLFKEKTPNII